MFASICIIISFVVCALSTPTTFSASANWSQNGITSPIFMYYSKPLGRMVINHLDLTDLSKILMKEVYDFSVNQRYQICLTGNLCQLEIYENHQINLFLNPSEATLVGTVMKNGVLSNVYNATQPDGWTSTLYFAVTGGAIVSADLSKADLRWIFDFTGVLDLSILSAVTDALFSLPSVCGQLKCLANLDVMIPIDDSATVGSSGLSNSLSLTTSLAGGLSLGRFGAISFDAYATIISNLTSNLLSLTSLLSTVNTVSANANVNGLPSAIDLANLNILSPRKIGSTPQNIVVITSKQPSDVVAAYTSALAAQANGIAVSAIGVGNNVTKSFLNQLTNGSYYQVNDYNSVSSILQVLLGDLCTGPSQSKCGPYCSGPSCVCGQCTKTLTTNAISSSALTTSRITSSAFTSSVISSSAITSSVVSSAALTTSAISTAAITTSQMTSAAITSSEITSQEMTTSEITTSEITSSEMTTSEITTSEISTSAVTSSEMTSMELTTMDVTSSPITSAPMTTSEITSASITSFSITSSAITSSEITSSAISTSEVTTSPLTTQEITTESGTTTSILSTSELTTEGLTTQEMTSSEITSQALSTSEITTQSVTSSEMTTEDISTSFVTTSEITSNTITEPPLLELITTSVVTTAPADQIVQAAAPPTSMPAIIGGAAAALVLVAAVATVAAILMLKKRNAASAPFSNVSDFGNVVNSPLYSGGKSVENPLYV